MGAEKEREIGKNTKGSHYYSNNDNYADSPALSLETCDSPVVPRSGPLWSCLQGRVAVILQGIII